MKPLGRLIALVLTILSAVLLTAAYLLLSPQGLDWAYRFATALLPGDLSIERLEGRLRGPMRMSGIHYHNDRIDVRIAQFDLEWQPGALVEGRLHVSDLAVNGLHILQTPSAAAAETTAALPDIRLPLTVQVDHAELHDFRFASPGGGDGLILDDAELQNAAFRRERLDLERLTVSAPQYHVTVSGNVTPRREYPLDLSVHWTADGGDYGALAGSGSFKGDLRKIDVRHQLTSPVRADFRGAVTDLLGKPGWQGELSWPAFDLHALNAAWPVLSVAGKVHGSGNLTRAQTEGELHSAYQNLHADHRFLIDYDHDRETLDVRRFITTLRKTGTELAVHGSLTDLGQTPRAELAGDWRHLRWPPQGEAAVRSASGTLAVSGTPDRYRLQLAGDVAGKQVPETAVSIDAAGDAQGLTVSSAEAHLLGGIVKVTGTLDWRAAPRWQLSVQGDDLDPGRQWPKWPGRISLAAQVDGAMADDGVRTQLTLSRLHGEVKAVPLDADAVVNVQGERLRLDKLRIDSGGNRLTAAGTLQDEWNMAWQIRAANLDRILPGGTGRLQGSGYVTGARLRPTFTASLSGRDVSFAANRIGTLSAVLAVDTQGRVPSTAEIEAQDIDIGDRHLDNVRLRADGTAQHHRAQLSAAIPAASVVLAVDGKYAEDVWQGSLDRFDLDAVAAGRWQLAAPAAISVAKSATSVQEFCLQQDHARLCAAAHMNGTDDWQLRTNARDLPLSILEAWLPEGTSLSGKLDAQGRFDATPAAPPTGEVKITLQSGAVSPAAPGTINATAPIAYRGGHLTATLDDRALDADLRLDLNDGGGVHGSLRIEREALPVPLGGGNTTLAGALTGRLQGDIRDLSLLPAFIPGIEHTRGRLHATLGIAGSWDRPQLSGEMRLENGAATIPSLGLNPDAVDIVVRGDEQGRLSVDAQLRSKDGTLHLGGNVRYTRPGGWDIEARLNGERAEIVNTTEYHILASPDMRLSVKGHRIDVTGELFIPEADLRPRDVSGAVSPSDDVVIVNAKGAAPAEERWLIYSDLRVRLGNFVKFNGFGLRGLLSGDFNLKDEPQKPTVARGELSIVNGEYRAYGQKLTVDRGRLLFFGGPVDNPGLDIRAVRIIQNATTVTAGILVRGTLKAPQVQLFSEPAMAETDALSYLLTGQPMNQATSAEGQQLYGAALSLGLAGSGLLASQIGQHFGIDQLTVESGGSFGTGALVIRHYLSPKLYISYGVGLVERFNVFLMRYQISRLWALDAESGGTQSGADLVYTLEKK